VRLAHCLDRGEDPQQPMPNGQRTGRRHRDGERVRVVLFAARTVVAVPINVPSPATAGCSRRPGSKVGLTAVLGDVDRVRDVAGICSPLAATGSW